jgi:DNA-binding CsgD family transcriptional regulator
MPLRVLLCGRLPVVAVGLTTLLDAVADIGLIGTRRHAELTERTPREPEVTRLVALDRVLAGAAAGLFIGEATVRTHLCRGRTKLGVCDRAEVVSQASVRNHSYRADSTAVGRSYRCSPSSDLIAHPAALHAQPHHGARGLGGHCRRHDRGVPATTFPASPATGPTRTW